MQPRASVFQADPDARNTIPQRGGLPMQTAKFDDRKFRFGQFRPGSERRRLRRWGSGALLGILIAASTVGGEGQNSITPPSRPRTTLLLPEANNLPDVNDQMLMKQKNVKKEDFEALNALRKQEIGDDATKLLILTKDLNEKMSKLGKAPMPPELVREAEVIEILARDVQKKMTLIVGAS
jgi:hypothetical protein